ncbi:MAG: glycoside hydrolase domain-containing protein [Candidatus Omnitrophota bacterium]
MEMIFRKLGMGALVIGLVCGILVEIARGATNPEKVLDGLRTAYVPLLQGTPEIDGKVDEPFWESAERLEPFILNHPVFSLPTKQTGVRLARDKENLYVAFECLEPNIFFNNDCIEVFLMTEPKGKLFYHLALDSVGQFRARKEMLKEGAEFDNQIKYAVSKGKESWTAEIAIPFRNLFVDISNPLLKGTWRVNFCRQEKEFGELSTWNRLVGPFRNPERFGKLVFTADENYQKQKETFLLAIQSALKEREEKVAKKKLEADERLYDFCYAFSFGPQGSPLKSGYRRVTPETAYTTRKGYGWTGTLGVPYDDPDIVEHTFRVDLLDGEYKVHLIMGEGGERVRITDGCLRIGFRGKDWIANTLVVYPAKDRKLAEQQIARDEQDFNLLPPEKLALLEEVKPPEEAPLTDITIPEKNRGFLVFTRDLGVRIFKTSIPKRSEITDKLTVRATPGETTNATLGVYPLKDLDRLKVTISGLTGSQGVISADRIEAGMVKTILHSTSSRYILLPFVVEPIRHVDTDLNEGATKQIWFTLRIPEDTAPGIYRGKIGLSVEEGGIPRLLTQTPLLQKGNEMTVKLNLTVLPFILAESQNRFGCYLPEGYGSARDELRTLNFEMARMGINDYRYIQTLTNLIEEGKKSGDKKVIWQAEEEETNLNKIADSVQGSLKYYDVHGYWKDGVYQELRDRITDGIIRLIKAMGKI